MTHKSKHIILIDDEPAMRKVLGIHLQNSGFITQIAVNGNEALEIINNNSFSPDCILLDIRMPDISGLDLLPKIKQKLPLVPVIMLTAHTDLETGLKAMRLGSFDYITKPVLKQELMETINKALKFREVLVENERLNNENRKYQQNLEKLVEDRTSELFNAYQILTETNLATVKVLAETIEAKDQYTRGHCNRVRELSRETAKHLGLSEDTIEILEYGALLHDIGKIGIPELLLHKNNKLNSEEKKIFNEHPCIGENILKMVSFFTPCLPIVRNHHEWYNGTGYPDKLTGSKIDILTKIVQLTDAFDAMTSNRPYRTAYSNEIALSELRKGQGTQFDPELVNLFIEKGIYLLS